MRLKTIGLIACLTSLLFACSGEQKDTPPPLPPPDVSVFETKAQEVPLFQDFVGQTAGLKDIAIRARLEGFLEGIHFQEGSEVKKGALLYTLESQPFEEKVATRMSQVAEVKTNLAKTKGDLDRIRPLAAINAVSQSDLDAAVAAYEANLSSLDAANATLRSAQIELSYTKIYSPIDGIIGRTKAKVGDFVGKDPNPVILNTVSQVDTILVNFFITETQYLTLAKHIAEQKGKQQDPLEDSLELILINGEVYNHKGRPDFIDREVDSTTGAMLVQASFPNPEKLLRPGQFAIVKTKVMDVNNAILIPQRCVVELQGLFNVFVVDESNKVETREIKVGPKVGSMWLISEGLQPGEKVVFEGLQKVKDGITVNPTIADVKSTKQDKT
ncbi:efflux RND transporter periplasmic adaptor subunit [Desulfogranum marinum]|uniref:efflux RND transporter periplasmic adaptor subunit n=1 Tax=Desulfogranum marinum TaxID=453220 RepID=UPI0019662396|nr:efflux RND transporter periplasmic adaptor subunit [Desulfogranum marinum]MBM9513835.1 efflux RND transporter periplasmic adaptor subunit [Desulfogranum marinum]